MMDKTECLIFINTPSSLTTHSILSDSSIKSTYSPWIYTEILASRIIKTRQLEEYRPKKVAMDSALESYSSLQIEYSMPTDHLIEISYDDLDELNVTKNPYYALDELYQKCRE